MAILLGIDVSTLNGSVAIVDDSKQVLAEYTSEDTCSYSKRLLQMIDQTLTSARLSITEVDGFAISSGPGSFTGLRIGLATVYGFFLSLDKPIIGISSLLAIANSFPHLKGQLCSIIDAKKKEVYAAFYKRTGDALEEVSDEMVIDPAQLGMKIDKPVTLIGKDAKNFKQIIEEKAKEPVCVADYTSSATSTAASAALIGIKRLRDNIPIPCTKMIPPNYIRRSDAEITWEEKYTGKNSV